MKKFPGIHCNAQLPPTLLRKYCQPDNAGLSLLKSAMEKLDLSARAYNHILKFSRTIADLDSSDAVKPYHLAEAINYRNLDRESWGK